MFFCARLIVGAASLWAALCPGLLKELIHVAQLDHNREFPFQMLKEVYEQPEAIRQTILQHIDPVASTVRPDRFPWTSSEVAALRRVTIVASGASRHAGLCGKLMIEDLAGIPVEVEHASEYGYRKPTNGKGSLVIAITQSGETADTTAAQRIAKDNG